MFILLITALSDGYRQAVGCFSHVYNNFLELSCPPGQTISVERVIFGAHPDEACPKDGSISAAEAHCCAPRCGDCLVENDRDAENVFSCNNKRECSIWTRSSYVDGCFPLTVTTYMVVLYKCNNTNRKFMWNNRLSNIILKSSNIAEHFILRSVVNVKV